LRGPSAPSRPTPASTPTRCWASSACRPRTSAACARRRWSRSVGARYYRHPMRTIRRGVVGAALAVLATAAPAPADRAAELGERLRKAIHARSTGFFAGAGPLRDPRAPRAERRLARRAARHPLRGARERAAVRQRAHHLLGPTQEALRRPR